MLALFAGGCAALALSLPTLTSWYATVLSALTGVPRWELLGRGGSLSFRPFLGLLIVLLGAFAVGSPSQRLKLLGFSCALYGAGVLALDLALVGVDGSWLPWWSSQVGGILAGFLGLLVIVISIFARHRLPAGVRIKTRVRTPRRRLVVLTTCAAFDLALVGAFSSARDHYLAGIHLPLVGGLDSQIVLFLLGIWCLLLIASALDRGAKPTSGPTLSVAFLIPAYNEAQGIGECIRALDAAAEAYPGHCRLYVVDNGSQDRTRQVAEQALAACDRLTGRVLECPTPGKSHALNFGLSRISEDVVVRIDADTLVAASILPTLVSWFWDPSVGGVSGLPLPKASTPRWLYPLRIIEVYYGAAFLRVAQGAADAVMVMPGLVASYRRDLLEELGGFGAGFNGEDADITMRIGRLGYRIITDPHVRVLTEVPETLAHLREQRQRWARGLFHMAARNMSSIWMCQGARGVWMLPWSILNAARRSMMIPILVCAATVEMLNPSVFSLTEVSVVAGFIVGLQLIVITGLLIAHRQFAALPFVPAYLVFRLFRAYISFETLLTLALKRNNAELSRAGQRSGAARVGRITRLVLTQRTIPAPIRPQPHM